MTLYQGQRYAEQIVPWLAPYCERIEIVGSVRRRRPVCNDVDLVCIPRLTTETRQVDMFTTERVVTSQLRQFLVDYVNGGNGSWLARAGAGNVPSPGGEGQGEGGPKPRAATNPEPKPDAQNLLLNLRSGVQLDIFCATAQTWATLQLCRTGSKEHNIWFAGRAKFCGGHWNPYRGLFIPSPLTERGQGEGSGQGEGGLVDAATEEDLYAALKLPYIAPENREPSFLRSLR